MCPGLWVVCQGKLGTSRSKNTSWHLSKCSVFEHKNPIPSLVVLMTGKWLARLGFSTLISRSDLWWFVDNKLRTLLHYFMRRGHVRDFPVGRRSPRTFGEAGSLPTCVHNPRQIHTSRRAAGMVGFGSILPRALAMHGGHARIRPFFAVDMRAGANLSSPGTA